MLIAEIGNNGLGSMDLNKELIYRAKKSGADMVKGQCIKADKVYSGSMPHSFYKQCEMSEQQYLDLIYYARTIGIDMFFSIFAEGFNQIKDAQNWSKLSASQSQANYLVKKLDNAGTFISIGINERRLPRINEAIVLAATEYCDESDNLWGLRFLKRFYNRSIGLSDHSNSISNCIKAIKNFDVRIIEKHFCLENQKRNIVYQGQLFRDSVHAATPTELRRIKEVMNCKRKKLKHTKTMTMTLIETGLENIS